MIPKKIHYVWIGDKPKPKFVLECIDTWKKYLPDYQIIEWNNESIKDIKNNYMEEAIKNKKWAFASDYIRLHDLYNEGGIYLDTDIEVTNSFNEFLELDFFTCHELYDNEVLPITSAVIGSKKNGDIIKDLLDIYMNIKFQNGTNLDLTPNTARITNYFKFKFNIQPPYNKNNTIELSRNSKIYPYFYFCYPEQNNKNYAIHHFSGSWLPSHSRKDKLNIFDKLILTRLIRIRNKGDEPILHNERKLFSTKEKNNKSYILLLRK